MNAEAMAFDGGVALLAHSLASILRARVLAITCGYEAANDLGRLRGDLCSQPTVPRWENAPDLKTIVRLTYALADS